MSKRTTDEIMAEWKELERIFREKTRLLNKEYSEALDKEKKDV